MLNMYDLFQLYPNINAVLVEKQVQPLFQRLLSSSSSSSWTNCGLLGVFCRALGSSSCSAQLLLLHPFWTFGSL